MSALDVGKIKFTWQGTYTSLTIYEFDDVVYHDGSAFICVAENPVTDSTPSDTNPDWNKIAQGSDLGAIVDLAAGDLVYFDGTDFARVPAPTDSSPLVSFENSTPVWSTNSSPVIQVCQYEHYAAQDVANGGFYYWGAASQYDISITTKRDLSKIDLMIRWFGEPNDHNKCARVQMCVDDESTNAWDNLKLPTFGQNTHMKLDYYEATGTDYNSTPKQGTYRTIIDTDYPAGTKLSFRLYTHNGGSMMFNGCRNNVYESAPTTLTLQEVNTEFVTIVRNGSTTGSW